MRSSFVGEFGCSGIGVGEDEGDVVGGVVSDGTSGGGAEEVDGVEGK